ncbi:Mediator of RNA polymerase II transcription subunit 7 [Lecanora helva]
MADQPQQTAVSAAFPAPPPFYKSFTTENLERQREYLDSIGHDPKAAIPSLDPSQLLSLPAELRNLFPPPPPPDGKYRSFGVEHDISTTSATESQIIPTPARLHTLTHNLLLSFLSLTNVLATNPGAYAPIWEELHTAFKEVYEVINGYRPHQARETLILMMEEQVEKVRGETKAVRESMERANDVLDKLRREEGHSSLLETTKHESARNRKKRRKEDTEKRVWEVLEKEVG